jgi:predicted enzyme related to lactoylglutathione lyase
VQLFVRVDDIDDYLARAGTLGAQVLITPQVLPEGDRIAVLLAPDGVSWGLLEQRRTT